LGRVRANPRCGDDTAGGGFARSDPQRRFDAWLAMLRTANNSPGPNTPAVATVDVVPDLYIFETAMACHDLADQPRDLPKPDPITARCETTTGVALLPDDVVFAALGGWIRRVLIDSAGVITDLGRHSRCFTGTAAQAARLLATACEQDGCIVPEAWSQIDHLTEWGRDRGATDQDNAGIQCGHHNRHKHRSGFRTRRDWHRKLHTQRPDVTWITPVGCDPPTETDLLTDTDIEHITQQRIDDLTAQHRGP
jgi:hypothetical protein